MERNNLGLSTGRVVAMGFTRKGYILTRRKTRQMTDHGGQSEQYVRNHNFDR